MEATTPVLSQEAAAILSYEDQTPESPFTWEDFGALFPEELAETLPLEDHYDLLLSVAEDGVITERSALLFLYGLTGSHEHYKRLYWNTVAEDAKQFALAFLPGVFSFLGECAQTATDITNARPTPLRPYLSLPTFAGTLIYKTGEQIILGALTSRELWGQWVDSDLRDPAVNAHAAFSTVTVIGSVALLGRGSVRVPTVLRPIPLIVQPVASRVGTGALITMVDASAEAIPSLAGGVMMAAQQPPESRKNGASGGSRPQRPTRSKTPLRMGTYKLLEPLRAAIKDLKDHGSSSTRALLADLQNLERLMNPQGKVLTPVSEYSRFAATINRILKDDFMQGANGSLNPLVRFRELLIQFRNDWSAAPPVPESGGGIFGSALPRIFRRR